MIKIRYLPVADPEFLLGRQPGGGGGHRDTILLKFPENCMKLRKIWSLGGAPRSATVY